MPSPICTICELDAKSRRVVEAVWRAGLALRDVVDFVTWWSQKNDLPIKVSKSSLDRHKQNGHMQTEFSGASLELDGTVLSLREYAKRLFEVYQKANKNKIPSTKEMIDFMLADAKLADTEARRGDEEALRRLLQGAAFTKPKDINSESETRNAGDAEDQSPSRETNEVAKT